MTTVALDRFDSFSEGISKIEFNKKLDEMNKSFKSGITPEKGYFGETFIDKGNGFSEIIKRNELGNISKDYYLNGNLVKNRTKIDNSWVTTRYDDNQSAYLKEISYKEGGAIKQFSMELTPDIVVKKGNFTAKTDMFGRPVFNEITDLQITGNRKTLSSGLKDSSYLELDQKGHIIADNFGGPATKENIVPQTSEVNQGKMAQVENIVRDYKSQGKKVDYSVKTNYVGESKRPSSFEPKIKVDGKEIELPKELKKIYNNGEDTVLSKAKTIVGEKAALNNKAGLKMAKGAIMMTAAISTVDNVSACINGEISAEEAVTSIAQDTGVAGVVAYGTGFVSNAVANATRTSSHQLIRSLGKSNVPAAVITFGVTSYDTVSDFAEGKIGAEELAIDLGENGVGIVGSIAGSAATGALVGSVVPGAGTAVGAAAGLVGGMVGYAVTTEAYKTAVEYAKENGEEIVENVGEFASDVAEVAVDAGGQVVSGASDLADKAQAIANDTIDKASELGDDVATAVKDAISDFNIANALPW